MGNLLKIFMVYFKGCWWFMCCIFGTTPDMSGIFFSIVRNTGCNCGSSTAFHMAYDNCPVLW